MDDYKVRLFLRYYWRDLVTFAIDLAELSAVERQAVELCGRQRLTIEQASEQADVSVNTMQARWSKARKRLSKAWHGIEWIELLAEQVEE